jgi:hypothetical protein
MPMKNLTITIIGIFLLTVLAQAEAYEVLVIDIAANGDRSKIAGFEKDAGRFNDLHRRGYSTAKPYFNLLQMASGQVYFVFGFIGEIQGIHRQNYPGTVKNLRSLKKHGAPKYPNMRWLPVEEIRKLINTP